MTLRNTKWKKNSQQMPAKRKKNFTLLPVFTIAAFFCLLIGCGRIKVTVMPGDRTESILSTLSESAEEVLESEEDVLASRLQIKTPTEDSMERLHTCGCGRVKNAVLREEKDGLYYFTVIDDTGAYYYADTDKNGYFGIILSESGQENAELLSVRLGFDDTNRNVLHTAETMEQSGIKKIARVRSLSKETTFQFEIETENGQTFQIELNNDGSVHSLKESTGKTIL